MKILAITKRQYMQKDLIDERFGRYWELLSHLAKRGHQIYGMTLSYKSKKEGELSNFNDENFKWASYNTGGIKLFGYVRFIAKIQKKIKLFDPDIVFGASDPLFIIAAVYTASKYKKKSLIDIFDNLHTYDPYKIPFVPMLTKKAINKADGIAGINQQIIDEYIKKEFKPNGPTKAIMSGVSQDFLASHNRDECRKKFQLPQAAKIIGTAGALYQEKGIQILLDGFMALAKTDEHLHLALAGPLDKKTNIPDHPRIHYKGSLGWTEVPYFLNALDIIVLCAKDNPFGHFAHPQKMFEFLACRKPVIASSVGVIKKIFANYPQNLYKDDSRTDFLRAIRKQFDSPEIPEIPIPKWDELAVEFEEFIATILRA